MLITTENASSQRERGEGDETVPSKAVTHGEVVAVVVDRSFGLEETLDAGSCGRMGLQVLGATEIGCRLTGPLCCW